MTTLLVGAAAQLVGWSSSTVGWRSSSTVGWLAHQHSWWAQQQHSEASVLYSNLGNLEIVLFKVSVLVRSLGETVGAWNLSVHWERLLGLGTSTRLLREIVGAWNQSPFRLLGETAEAHLDYWKRLLGQSPFGRGLECRDYWERLLGLGRLVDYWERGGVEG